MPSRRQMLGTCSGAVAALSGCLSGFTHDDTPADGSDGPGDSCVATGTPYPTEAATSPREYPARPDDLTRESVRAFLAAFERAFQYNDRLATHPDKYGRTNEITVRVDDVALEDDSDGFGATVTGQVQTDFLDGDDVTPETPTDTPLPIGHGPFEVQYVVTERFVRREGATVACW